MTHSYPTLITGDARRAFPGSNGLRTVAIATLYTGLILSIVAIGVVTGLNAKEPMLWATLVASLILLPLLWARPIFGVYILVGGVAVFETFPLNFPDSVTDQAVFFQTINSAGGPGFLLVNGAEVLMSLSLITVVLRRLADRKRPLEFGPLFGPIALYTVMVAFGFVNGMRRGGDFDIALWEMRGQIYLILVYLLVVNTVDTKQQVTRLFWVFMAGVAIKGLVGTWRFLITMGGDLDMVQILTKNSNSILSHEESYFFALFIMLAMILVLFRGHRLQVWFAVVTVAPIIIAMMANERRSGMLALLMGVVMAVSLAYLFDKGRRRPIIVVTVALLFVMPIYVAATWNGTGVIAEPARALRSLVSPDPRDFESNDYRRIEDLDLKYNIQSHPILGHGYGKTITFYIPLPYIGDRFYFWDIIPHNTVLWIWLRLGVLGFSAFWFMVGRSIVASMMAARDLQDPYLKSIGVFVVVALVTWIFTGLVDMGIVGMRETVLMGALMGVVSRLPTMERNAKTEAADDSVVRRRASPRRIGLPASR